MNFMVGFFGRLFAFQPLKVRSVNSKSHFMYLTLCVQCYFPHLLHAPSGSTTLSYLNSQLKWKMSPSLWFVPEKTQSRNRVYRHTSQYNFCFMHRWCFLQSHVENYIKLYLIQLFHTRSTTNGLPPVFHSALSSQCHLYMASNRQQSETGYVKKGQALWELHSLHAFRSMGLSQGHFLGGPFSKGACTAVLAEGSTVGQLLMELQPLLCGGVGQIRPHNCLLSHTGTAASLHPLKPVADCWSLREPSVRNKQTQ